MEHLREAFLDNFYLNKYGQKPPEQGGFFMEKFMQNRERYLTLGNVICPDPTAWKAIRSISQSSLSAEITDLDQELRELNEKRKKQKITKQEYTVQRRPLVTRLKDISQAHLLIKEGGR